MRSWAPPGGGWVKSFCAECAGHLFTTNAEDAEMVSVRMGALDDDPGARPPRD